MFSFVANKLRNRIQAFLAGNTPPHPEPVRMTLPWPPARLAVSRHRVWVNVQRVVSHVVRGSQRLTAVSEPADSDALLRPAAQAPARWLRRCEQPIAGLLGSRQMIKNRVLICIRWAGVLRLQFLLSLLLLKNKEKCLTVLRQILSNPHAHCFMYTYVCVSVCAHACVC